MKSRIYLLLLGLLLPCVALGQDYANMVFPNSQVLGGRITLQWKVMDEDIIFKAEARTGGYIGIGFSQSKTMVQADLILAGVRSGTPYITDAFSSANGLPKVDTSQDVDIKYGNEMNGMTTVIFQRKIVSSDSQDRIIRNGPVGVIWALGSDYNGDPGYGQYHATTRGSATIEFYKEQIASGLDEKEEFDDGVKIDESDKELPYYRYLDSQDKVLLKWGVNGAKNIRFLLSVETRGWIGLGFTNSHDMRNADIMLMGVFNNKPYLYDAFAPDNFLPAIDPSQDITLLESDENGTHTTMKFERKLINTDRFDKPIENKDIYVIWAAGLYDIIGEKPGWMDYHYLWKGHVAMNLLSGTKKADDELETVPDNAPKKILASVRDFGDVVLRWTANDDQILFELTGPTDGWVGLGIAPAPDSGMRNADITIAGLKDGKRYVFDMLATRNTLPRLDPKQNVEIIDAKEVGKKTTVYLRRKLISPDLRNDRDIEKGEVNLIWAFGLRDLRGARPNYVDYHRRNRGSIRIDLLGEVEMANDEAGSYPYDVYLDAKKEVQLQWRFDDENIEFRYTVPTTGWAGLGFSSNKTMANADLAMMSYSKKNGRNIKDLYSTINGPPMQDEENSFILDDAIEMDGRSIFKFQRPRKAMTPGEDRPINEGDINLIWAFGNSDAFGPIKATDYHFKNRGAVTLTLIPPKPIDEDSQFRYFEFLDDKNTIFMQWNFNDLEIVFEVTAPTTGWLGLGFNSQQNPNMVGSDLMIMTKDQSGNARAIDAFSTENGVPSVDPEQGVEMLSSSQNGTHSTYRVRRSRVAQFVNDRSLAGPVQVLWAYGENDIEGNPKQNNYHFNNRGNKLVILIRETIYDVIIGTEILDARRGVVLQWASPFPNMLFMQFSAPTTGWLGLGFSKTPSMKGADLAMFGIKDGGEKYLYDLHGVTTKNTLPIKDASDDIQLVEGLEHGGRTLVMLARNMTVKPSEVGSDLPITNKKIYVLWAYGENDLDGLPTGKNYHGIHRGSKEVDLVPTLPDMTS